MKDNDRLFAMRGRAEKTLAKPSQSVSMQKYWDNRHKLEKIIHEQEEKG